MLRNITRDQLLQLNLKAFAQSLEDNSSAYIDNDLSFQEQLSIFLDIEINDRKNKKVERLLKSAKLRYSNATIEDIDYKASRKLKKSDISHLFNCEWVEQHHNVIITGATGCGKTWLACALANQACRLGISTLYIHANQLFEDISLSILDGSLAKYRQKLIKTKLLLIDDLGIGGIDASVSPTLLEIVDRQSMNGGLILTSQFPTERWHDFFEDKTVADAILDRVIHNSHKIELFGESMRKMKTLK